MKKFMDNDFLLSNKTAQELYSYAKAMPIVDYHCHIPVEEIANDRKFSNITELWLGADHYKWRLMRAYGIEEKYITGNASDYDKFCAFAKVLERAIGNPLYHWSHLELKTYFDYDGILDESTMQDVWNICNAKLANDNYSARNLMLRSNVKLICTTDDPIDNLKYHKQLACDTSFPIRVLPAFRPDNALFITHTEFTEYIQKLADVTNIRIDSAKALVSALVNRIEYFDSVGCKLADHGVDYVIGQCASYDVINTIFNNAINGITVTKEDELHFQTYVLRELSQKYKQLNWISQLHYGCSRNNNPTMYKSIGANTGFDCIAAQVPNNGLIDFLAMLESNNSLPKTIVYSLNPNDNDVIDTIIACFQNAEAYGYVQHGAAWWFNDHKDGIRTHIRSLAANGLLANWVGMLTDSRSFVSYTRHDYFRRILCDYLGTLVENGEFPYKKDVLKQIVEDISYNNAINYFDF